MKILQINTLEKIGGAAMVAYRLHNEFQKNHKSKLLVGTKSSNDKNVIEFPFFIRKLRKQTNMLERHTSFQYFFDPSYLWFLKKNNYLKYDIMNLHNIHGDYFNIHALWKILKHKKVVWTLHDMWAMTGHCACSFGCKGWKDECEPCPHLNYYPAINKDKAHYLFKIKKKILNHPNLHIVTPSNWLKELVEESMSPRNKISLIYNGIDQSIYKPRNKLRIRRKLGIDIKKKVILFNSIGRNNPYKGFSYLMEALKKIKNKNNILLLIIGDDKDFKAKGFDTMNIGFINSEKKMSEYYACADILLYPSIQDNCPLVVLEAMSCGLPIVTFDTGGIPELVQHKKTGYIAKYKDVDDLFKGMNLLLKNPDLRKKYGFQARKRVKKYFTLKKQTQNYLRLYNKLLGENK
jgi:glycosyltransferase involved in cell wall biosynthesis